MIENTANKLRDKLFNTIHSNNLIYNTCWKDPKVDRKLLQLNEESNIVMITSAGCNALDYLLDTPTQINCVDMNPKQNALLELKLSLIRNTNNTTLFKFFGTGTHKKAKNVYEKKLRAELSQSAQEFWDEKIKYFEGKNKNSSFYFKGTSGKFAWLVNQFIKAKPKFHQKVENLFNSKNIEQQKTNYIAIERIFSNILLKWFLNMHLTMALLGVPREQYTLIKNEFPEGLQGYLKEKFRKIFTELSIQNNYFWRVYFFGSYTRNCCPNYLKSKNFELLKCTIDNINISTNTITNFLKENPNKYTHFILLDHQDWLAVNNPTELEAEWKMIFECSQKGTKILLRTASFNRDFLPNFVFDKVEFEDESVKKYEGKDRVGTYGSTHLCIVK